MNCPVCGCETTVLSSRSDPLGVYRRRVCKNPECDHRFFTNETASDGTEWRRIQAAKIMRSRKIGVFRKT